MTTPQSLIIRGGLVMDGTGGQPSIADIRIDGDTITEVGQLSGSADRESDAKGLLVTPGFVDIHTHYDGQVTWNERVSSSSQLGVTTVVMGNCGVGLAPCSPQNRRALVTLMEGIEDIPGIVLEEGLTWDWESFPDYLDALEARQFDIDVATQIGHAPLRIEVMGERASRHEVATPADRAEMARLAAQAITAGALGFTTSRTIIHKGSDGEHTPTLHAEQAELLAIAEALREIDQGVIQLITDFEDVDGDFAMLRRICETSGRPMSMTLLQHEHLPERWRQVMQHMHEATAAGLPMKAQVGARPVALIFGLGLSMCPFSELPAYEAIKDLPVPERLIKMRDPLVKAQILSQTQSDPVFERRVANFDNLYVLGDPPDYEPKPEDSLAAMAKRAGKPANELAYELLTEGDGETLFYRPLYNYAEQNLNVLREMLMDPDSVPGLSDGGAHYGYICDASFPIYLLTYWGRDRTRGERIDLPLLVKWQTADAAATVGLHDRGLIKPGYKADLNLLDFKNLRLEKPAIVRDLPAQGRRLAQEARGVVASIVSGVVTYEHGKPTGKLPGRLIRGAKHPKDGRLAA